MNYDPNNSYDTQNGAGADLDHNTQTPTDPQQQGQQGTWQQGQGSWQQPQSTWQQPQGGWQQPQGTWQQGQGNWQQQNQGTWQQPQGTWQQPQGAWQQNQSGWQQPNAPYYPPAQAPNESNDASTSKTLGIVGLILALVCCPLAGLILGILACTRAKRAKQTMGFEPPDAATGRVCGIVAIVVGALSMFSSVLITVIEILLLA